MIAFIATFIIEGLMLLYSRQAYRLFISDENVIDIGVMMINVIAPFFFTYLFVEILSGAIRGTGKTFIPTLITVFGIVGIRTVWLIVVPKVHNTVAAIIFCYPVTWIICAVAFVLYYRFGRIYTKTLPVGYHRNKLKQPEASATEVIE